MANYEKRVEQEAAYPIPISLYNCYRTVRHEERHSYRLLIAFLMPHCPVTVVQRYRDGVCSLLFHSFFIICHPYIPLHLEEMIFILVHEYRRRLRRRRERERERRARESVHRRRLCDQESARLQRPPRKGRPARRRVRDRAI